MTVEAQVQVTEYEVSCLPADHPEHYTFAIKVAWRGPDSWAVVRMASCLDAEGNWDWEPSPSNRDDDWLATHRFDLDTAMALAKEAAPRIVVNGWTIEKVLARRVES
jgi:hypothetical protein